MENHWLKKFEGVQELVWPYLLNEEVTEQVELTIPISASSLTAMTTIAKDSSLNILKLLMGSLAIVIWKYTGQEDIVIALPPLYLADADSQEHNIYCVLHLNPLFKGKELLSHVHDSLNDAYLHSKYDEEQLHKQLAHTGNISLFNEIGMSFLGATLPSESLGDHRLVFDCTPTRIAVSTKHSHLPQAMLQDMAEGLIYVASNFSINKEQPIASVSLTPLSVAKARYQQFYKRKDYPVDNTVVDLFNQQAKKNPSSKALIYNNESITYAELDEWSENIADYIFKFKKDDAQLYIGVMITRSPAMIAAILGILRAGAAYIPIDPTYPTERIREIAITTEAPFILTGSADPTADKLLDYRTVDIYSLPQAQPQSLPRVSPEGVAYVIYSSGTTGKPKGIMIQHKAIINLLHWYNERYEINKNTRIVQLTNVVVDIAFQEIFSALINGLTLYIPKQEEQQDKQLFIEWLNKYKINFIQLIPDLLATYFTDIPKLEHLDLVLCGGDKLNDRLKDKIVEKGYKLFNIYGQTETAIDTVGAECHLGEPTCFNDYVPNYEVLILDNEGNICPDYVAGEIHTAGAGLALGYLANPSATAEKFVPHPFYKDQKIYRTGDRARRMPDGSLRLLGREDQQVKIMGYRIELEEIENLLHKQPDIEAAAVIVKTNENGYKHLAAFIVSAKKLNLQECITYIKQWLPAYMLPDFFVQIDRLPLNPTGKVDRKALEQYNGELLRVAREIIAPRNKVEAKLLTIWEEVLDRTGISIKDNFFEIGGHSLKITRLVSRIRKVFEVSINLKEIFLSPVLEDQAILVAESASAAYVGIAVVAEAGRYAVSSAQRRLWLLSQFEGSSAAYNIPGVTAFTGPLDPAALARAFAAVLERHQSLRTVFEQDPDGTLYQRVLPADQLGFALAYHDLRAQPDADARVQAQLRADCQAEFPLATGPLLRAALYQLDHARWVFSYVMHHIISDGWSMSVLFADLLRSYAAASQGRDPALPALRLHYKDYAAWHAQQLAAAGPHQRYWHQQLAGELPVLALPLDHPRPAVKTYRGGLVRQHLPLPALAPWHALLRAEGCTLFMGLLALVNTLLYRYSGQAELVVGSPVAGREHGDLEEQIGFYVNTLALRTHLDPQAGFGQLLRQVKAVTLGAYAHQAYPFERVVSELGLVHHPARSAVFDVMVALQNAGGEGPPPALPAGLVQHPYGQLPHVSSKFDLLFNFFEAADGLHTTLEYNSDLFERATIERLGAHLHRLLAAAAAQPDLPLALLPYLQPAEIHQLLHEFNRAGTIGYPVQATIVSLFENQAAQTPEHVAVVFGEKRLSYRELNTKANQLAHYLRESHHLRADSLVGLLLERTEWIIVSILATLKAGGAYVPIDPNYPQERIDFMLNDSGCAVLIDALELERFTAHAQLFATTNPVPVSTAASLAYLIYTSGTTGQPKGSLISHTQVVRLFKNDQPLFDFGSNDVWTLFHSYCFDFSVWEMYGALLFGGCVVVVPLMVAKDPGAYLDLLLKERVTVLNQTPSAFYSLMEAEDNHGVPSLNLRYVIFGGEALSPGRLRSWKVRYPHTRLINMYGITETTVHVTFKEIEESGIINNINNIGTPIPTLRTYVLDAQQQLLPIGVWGELYVGGAGVAKGYLNRDSLTKERFVNSWFESNDRLYRSGDRVRILANGEMEYDGRLDEQVKIRGHRIELGEIEACLEAHEEINRAIVIAKVAPNDSKELVAYVVGDASIKIKDLRRQLSIKLPDYMIPAYIILLDELPLTTNGKIDRKNLPQVDISTQLEKGHTAPSSPMQQLLLDVWQQVLGLQGIGIHDNFFSIGGNSISLIEIISKAKRHKIQITTRQMFESPTIYELSSVALQTDATSLEQGPVTGRMRLLPIQQWYFENQQLELHHFNYSAMVATPSNCSAQQLLAIARLLLEKHDVLRLRFPAQYDGTASFEEFSEDMVGAAAQVVNCGDWQADERNALISKHSISVQTSISLQQGPLFRIVWYDYGNTNAGRLVVVVHHLVVDGVSWRILMSDLNHLFTQLVAKEPFDLGNKTSSYKAWSEKLVQYAKSAELLSERSYWYNILRSSDVLFSPSNPSPTRLVADQQQVTLTLSEDYTSKLLYNSLQAYNTTVREVLLTALMIATTRWNNVDKLLIHQEGHGRENIFQEIDLSQTLGWFTSIYPILLYVQNTGFDRGDEIGKTIRYVKESLNNIPNNGIGYGILRYLNQDETIQQLEQEHPAAVLFNYLGDLTQAQRNSSSEIDITSIDPTISPHHKVLYQLEINGAIVNKSLRFNISYIRTEYERHAIEQLANAFKKVLENIIDHCIQLKKPRFIASNFWLTGLSQLRIEEIGEEFPNMVDLYPATSMQQAMFFQSMASEGEGAYIVQQHGYLKNIDPDTFVKAWEHLVERHSVLRTVFTLCEKNGLLQVVSNEVKIPYVSIDCRNLSEVEWERKISTSIAEDAVADFDFETAPLLRYTLLQRNINSFYIILSIHHIILDGWSMPILFSELNKVYAMLSRNEPVILPHVLSYGKYVEWLLTQNKVESSSFWSNKFRNAEEITKLEVHSNTSPELSAPDYKELVTELTPRESHQLRYVAAKYQVTLHTLLIAAWAKVLSLYANAEEVVFGMTISGRSEALEGVQEMVGLCINSIPIKVSCNRKQHLAEWLTAIHYQQMEYNQYGLIDLKDIRKLNNLGQSTQLFETLFVHQNYPNQLAQEQTNSGTSFEFSNAGFKDENNSALTVMVFSKMELSFLLIYKAGIFNHSFVQELANEYKNQLISFLKENELSSIT